MYLWYRVKFFVTVVRGRKIISLYLMLPHFNLLFCFTFTFSLSFSLSLSLSLSLTSALEREDHVAKFRFKHLGIVEVCVNPTLN